MYYLSLFRMPKKVAGRIIQLQSRFFWGKKDGGKGGNLIAWNTIQKPMGHGGLGVGDIYIRNASLLFKWWWRFVDDQKPLWKDIVISIHGPIINGDAQRVKGKCQTSLWGQINNFKRFGNEIEEVAKKGIQVKVGNGGQTKFLIDHWLGETSLKNTFPRLFMLSTQKDNFIEEMGE